jgi:regulator of sigma E protease
VVRDGAEIVLTATPRRGDRPDGLGNQSRVGILGVAVDQTRTIEKRLGPVEALGAAARQVVKVLEGTVRFLGRLVQGKESADQLGGPVKVFKYASQAMQIGPDMFISLAAVMSISIGFLNLLPIPVLDGGHLMYYAYEAATGRPLGARAQAIGFRIGLVLLVSFMLFVTWNDIKSLIS